MKNVEELREAADVYEHGWLFPLLQMQYHVYLMFFQLITMRR